MRGLRLGLGLINAILGSAAKPTMPFGLTVDTTRVAPGGSVNVTTLSQFRLPLNYDLSNYNFTVTWGDGSVDVVTNSLNAVPVLVSTAPSPGASTSVGTYVVNGVTIPYVLHTYAAGGVYAVNILGRTAQGFPAIRFEDNLALTQAAAKATDAFKVNSLNTWGNGTWTSMKGAFQGANFMTTAGLSDIATAKHASVAIWDRSFTYSKAMTVFPAANLSAATDITSMCNGCSVLASMPFVDTSKVIKANFAWVGCSSLTAFPALNMGLNANFTSTWDGCSGLTTFPVIDVSKGTTFQSCWRGCAALATFPVLNFALATSVLQAWQNCVSLLAFPATTFPLVTTFATAFRGCTLLASATLVAPVATSMSETFRGCPAFNSIPLTDVQTQTTLANMFNAAVAFKQNLGAWWPKLVTAMTSMFSTVDINAPNSATNQTNYSALLKGWTGWTGGAGGSSSKSLQNNVVFSAGTSKYSLADANAVAARAYLVLPVGSGGRGWTITDGGGI